MNSCVITLLRLCVTQKALKQPFLQFFSPILVTIFEENDKIYCVFFFYFCFKHLRPISDLLTCYAVYFQALSFKDKH